MTPKVAKQVEAFQDMTAVERRESYAEASSVRVWSCHSSIRTRNAGAEDAGQIRIGLDGLLLPAQIAKGSDRLELRPRDRGGLEGVTGTGQFPENSCQRSRVLLGRVCPRAATEPQCHGKLAAGTGSGKPVPNRARRNSGELAQVAYCREDSVEYSILRSAAQGRRNRLPAPAVSFRGF
jgi:hypothetical protein